MKVFADDAVNDEQLQKKGDETLREAVASAKDPKGSLKQSFLELCNDNDLLTVNKKVSYLTTLSTKPRMQRERKLKASGSSHDE